MVLYNYAYDDEGNLIRRTEIASNKVTEYQWDYRNRLAGVFDKNATGNTTQEVGFKYDAMNRRISKKVGSTETRFVYDRNNVLFDFTASGANQPVLDKRYLFGAGVDQLLAQESAQGSVLWGLSDQLGTVKDWVNNSGSVANHVRYDSFGGVVSQSNPALGSRYGFTGREFDAETGLYYYRSRYYNPGIGRFIGEDAIGFEGGDANLYRYVGNNSINSVDPSGFLVVGVYDRGNKELLLVDGSRRSTTVTVNVFSGTGEAKDQPQLESVADKGPIPKGRYEILEHTVQDWYRLDRLDSKPRNDKDDDLYGRGAFRLHPGTRSLGCITIPSDTKKGEEDWSKIKNMLDRTETEIVEDNLGRAAFLLSLINRAPKSEKIWRYCSEMNRRSFVAVLSSFCLLSCQSQVRHNSNYDIFVSEAKSEPLFLVKIRSNEGGLKSGYINQNGRIVIEATFEEANDFREGLAIVKLGDNNFVYINTTGKIVISPPQKWTLFDDFSEGLARVIVDQKYGYINQTGKIVISSKFNEAHSFSEKLAAVKIGNKWGYIDKSGKTIIAPQFVEANSFSEELAAVKIGNKWGYIDKFGKTIIAPQFVEANSFSEKLAAVKIGNKWGYIDKSGKTIIAPLFDRALRFSNKLALVTVGYKESYIAPTGKVVIPLNFSAVEPFVESFSEGLALVKIGEKWGYIDLEGKIAILPQFDEARGFEGGLAGVSINTFWSSKYGYINKKGKWVWSSIY
jgi:RHS repeat-associated protein